MMDSQKHVLSKIVKNKVLYHKSFQVMLYIKVTEIIVVVTSVILNFSESRNKDDKFGLFVAGSSEWAGLYMNWESNVQSEVLPSNVSQCETMD